MIVKERELSSPYGMHVERASKEVEEEVGGGRLWWRGPCLSPGLLSMVCKSRLCTLCSSEGEVRLVSRLLLFFASRYCLISRGRAPPEPPLVDHRVSLSVFLSCELPSSKALPSRRCEGGGNSCLASRSLLTIVSNSGYARRATSLSYFLYPIYSASYVVSFMIKATLLVAKDTVSWI